MRNKAERQTAIRRIIQGESTHTQSGLVERLQKLGFDVNQATLSRDLGEMAIRKANGRYCLPHLDAPTYAARFPGTVLSIEPCGPHLIILRTAIGQAQAVAVAIDTAGESAFAGTIAGDDTIIVATKNRRTQAVAMRRLVQWYGPKGE